MQIATTLFTIKREMAKIMQNLIVLMESFKDNDDISLKGGNMCLNRFVIDEDAAFELSGVHYLKKSSRHPFNDREKGKGWICLQFMVYVIPLTVLYKLYACTWIQNDRKRLLQRKVTCACRRENSPFLLFQKKE